MYFTDHMVIQANQPIRIFGEGCGTAEVEFLGNKKSITVSENEWCLTLPEADYGGPYEMKIILNGSETILKDIYMGEVWLCTGQSNMEMPLLRTEYGIEEADHSFNDKIRLFTVARRTHRDIPACGWHFECETGEDKPWKICSPDTSVHFSAIGYYVAKELQQKLGAAVGMISCNWGGVPVETYIKRDYFENSPYLKSELDKYNEILKSTNMKEYMKAYHAAINEWQAYCDKFAIDELEQVRQIGIRATIGLPLKPLPQYPDGPYQANMPGCLYDAMVARIAPFGIKGVLWYQGESNHAVGYSEKYGVFMKCWKEVFENPRLKFYAVELASFFRTPDMTEDEIQKRYEDRINWSYNREEQYRAVEKYPDNYIATTMDLGMPEDIHPIQKKELSHRLALKVLKYSYDYDIYADQPTYKSAEFKDGKVYIYLDNSDGLYTKKPDEVRMYIADSSMKFKPAVIEAVDGMLIVSSDDIKNPVAVRYAFDDYYIGAHIFNKAGLPLAPFRTDKD